MLLNVIVPHMQVSCETVLDVELVCVCVFIFGISILGLPFP